MRKISSVCLVVMLTLGVFTACGNTPKTESTTATAATKVEKTAEVKGQRKDVVLTIEGKRFEAQIEENENTKQILDKLPMDIPMSNLGGANLIYGGSFKAPKEGFHRDCKKGDLAICHVNYFIVFFDNQPSSYHSEFYSIGKITSNLESLGSISSGGKMHVELKK